MITDLETLKLTLGLAESILEKQPFLPTEKYNFLNVIYLAILPEGGRVPDRMQYRIKGRVEDQLNKFIEEDLREVAVSLWNQANSIVPLTARSLRKIPEDVRHYIALVARRRSKIIARATYSGNVAEGFSFTFTLIPVREGDEEDRKYVLEREGRADTLDEVKAELAEWNTTLLEAERKFSITCTRRFPRQLL